MDEKERPGRMRRKQTRQKRLVSPSGPPRAAASPPLVCFRTLRTHTSTHTCVVFEHVVGAEVVFHSVYSLVC